VTAATAASPPGPLRDEEITDFFAAHYNGLRSYLRACGCPAHDADDVAQDSFLAVRGQWDHVRTYDSPKAYLYKVAVRRFGRLRKEQARKDFPVDPGEHAFAYPDPADAIAAADRRAEAMTLLRQLPLRQRQVLWLREAVGFSVAETADILSISAGTVKSTCHDARASIQKLEAKASDGDWRTEPR
jgi:RNA polymerase sigma factor (sigma-70 family)